MLKEIIEAWEKLTWFEHTGKTPETIYNETFRSYTDEGILKEFEVYNNGNVYLKYFHRSEEEGLPIPHKWHKGIYEIGRGNIFWEDEMESNYFKYHIDTNENKLNDFIIMRKKWIKDKPNCPYLEQWKWELKILEWILKYKLWKEKNDKR